MSVNYESDEMFQDEDAESDASDLETNTVNILNQLGELASHTEPRGQTIIPPTPPKSRGASKSGFSSFDVFISSFQT